MEQLSRSQKAALKEQRQDFQLALGHEPTRKLLRRLLTTCGLFDRNPEGDKYLEGRRSVAMDLISEMTEIDVHAFPRLMQEGANEFVRKKTTAEKAQLEQDE